LESDSLKLIYLEGTRRVEAVSSTKQLDADKVPYVTLAETTRSEVKKNPVAIAKIGQLKWLEEIRTLSPSIEQTEDNSDDFKKALKWTAGIQITLLLLLLLLGHFVNFSTEKEAPTLVTIVPRPEQEKPQPKKRREIVEVTEHKVEAKKLVVHKAIPHKVVKMAQLRPNLEHVQKSNQRANHGESDLLGSLEKADQQGGLKLNAMKTSRGVGLGGSEGSGGIQTSVYGSGLIAAPLGPQAKAMGAGGYGTHGKGGGKMTLVGSSHAYFQPVEQEASVEGGLDREEIAAVIQRHLGQIRFCYEQGLQVKPNLNGRVAIRFFINASGTVSTANVSNTSLHSGAVEGCITSALKGWKFPEPRGGVIVKVTYPFVLKRVSQS
jgi:hypothetical protein